MEVQHLEVPHQVRRCSANACKKNRSCWRKVHDNAMQKGASENTQCPCATDTSHERITGTRRPIGAGPERITGTRRPISVEPAVVIKCKLIPPQELFPEFFTRRNSINVSAGVRLQFPDNVYKVNDPKLINLMSRLGRERGFETRVEFGNQALNNLFVEAAIQHT